MKCGSRTDLPFRSCLSGCFAKKDTCMLAELEKIRSGSEKRQIFICMRLLNYTRKEQGRCADKLKKILLTGR